MGREALWKMRYDTLLSISFLVFPEQLVSVMKLRLCDTAGGLPLGTSLLESEWFEL